MPPNEKDKKIMTATFFYWMMNKKKYKEYISKIINIYWILNHLKLSVKND
jgi:hypothetical protein